MSRGRRLVLPAIAVVGTVAGVAMTAWALLPGEAPGHRPLHIGCNHNHGPKRTDGAGQRLLDARALARQTRQPASQ